MFCKKDWCRCFPVEFVKLLRRTPFSQNTSGDYFFAFIFKFHIIFKTIFDIKVAVRVTCLLFFMKYYFEYHFLIFMIFIFPHLSYVIWIYGQISEAYSEPFKKMERFVKTVNGRTLHLRCLTGFWILLRIWHMHSLSSTWKHQKTVRFSDVFKG